MGRPEAASRLDWGRNEVGRIVNWLGNDEKGLGASSWKGKSRNGRGWARLGMSSWQGSE